MTGRVTRQSRQRPLKCPLSRSDGRGQGRRKPASSPSAPLTARRRGGYPILTLVLTQPATRVRFDGGNSRNYPLISFHVPVFWSAQMLKTIPGRGET